MKIILKDNPILEYADEILAGLIKEYNRNDPREAALVLKPTGQVRLITFFNGRSAHTRTVMCNEVEVAENKMCKIGWLDYKEETNFQDISQYAKCYNAQILARVEIKRTALA